MLRQKPPVLVSCGQTTIFTGPYRLKYKRPYSDNACAKKRSGHARTMNNFFNLGKCVVLEGLIMESNVRVRSGVGLDNSFKYVTISQHRYY